MAPSHPLLPCLDGAHCVSTARALLPCPECPPPGYRARLARDFRVSRHAAHSPHCAYGAGATALAVVAAISVAALMPGSSGIGDTSNVQLTARTVQKQSNGTVGLTIRDMLDLAGLQRELNADGVPAVIPAGSELLLEVFRGNIPACSAPRSASRPVPIGQLR